MGIKPSALAGKCLGASEINTMENPLPAARALLPIVPSDYPIISHLAGLGASPSL